MGNMSDVVTTEEINVNGGDSAEPVRFRVGARYRHTTGKVMQVLAECDTWHWGHALIAENMATGELIPVGSDADNASNWIQVPPFGRCEYCGATGEIGAVSVPDPAWGYRDRGVCREHFDDSGALVEG